MQYGCPQCGAPPGRPCVTTTDHVKTEVHVARSRLASAEQWTEHEEQQMPTCPDCQSGKHANCVNEAWDFDKDEATECACFARDHQET
jgi:hypothetical protein